MKLAIYDFDGTLFNKETIPYLLDKWEDFGYSSYARTTVRKKILKKYFLKKIKLLSKENFRAQATVDFLRIFDGMKREEIDDFFKKSSKDINKFFNQKIIDEIKKSSEKGYNNVMISGCFQIMLDYALNDLPFYKIIGTKLPITDNGMNLERDIKIISGSKKRDIIEKNFDGTSVDWKESKAFGDSIYDRYVMELTGHPTAVKPDDKLRSYAEKNNWDIIE
jgi:phosphoserine phosphatase